MSQIVSILVLDNGFLPLSGQTGTITPRYRRNDGTTITPTSATVTEPSATLFKGLYEFTLTDAEAGTGGTAGGSCSTSGSIVMPTTYSNGFGKLPATVATGDIADIPTARAAFIDKCQYLPAYAAGTRYGLMVLDVNALAPSFTSGILSTNLIQVNGVEINPVTLTPATIVVDDTNHVIPSDNAPSGWEFFPSVAPSGWITADSVASGALIADISELATKTQADAIQAQTDRIDASVPGTGPVIVIPDVNNANQTTGVLITYDKNTEPADGIAIHFRLISTEQTDSATYSTSDVSFVSSNGGVLIATLLKNSVYSAYRGSGTPVTVTTENSDTFIVPVVLGNP